MRFRNLEEQDIPQIRAIIDEGAPYLGHYGYYVYWIMKHLYDGYSFVAEEGDRVCGFVTALPNPDQRAVFIWQLGVAKDMRRKQVAYGLLKSVWDVAVQKGLPGMITSIDAGNKGSRNSFGKIARENGLTGEIIGKFEADGYCEDLYLFRQHSDAEK